MKTTIPSKFSVGAWLAASLVVVLAERSLAQSNEPTNMTLPVITLRVPDAEASEPGTNTGRFVLNRAGPTNLALNVFLQISGTASNGVDYLAIPNWIPIPAGVRELPIPVRPIDDDLFEGRETVEARLVYPPIMPPIAYQIGSPSNGVVSIYDNDPAPTNRPPVVRIVAPANGAVFVAPVDILLAARAEDPDVTDYVATVEFFAGTNSLGVTTNNPLGGSPVNPFMLVWSNAPIGCHRLVARATDNRGAQGVSAPVEICVREFPPPPPPPPPPPLVGVEATDPRATEPGMLKVLDAGEFTITRSYGTNAPLLVYLSITGTASNGADYVALSNSVIIPAGRLSTKVRVLPLPDTLVEPVETVVLQIEPPICPTNEPPPYECYQIGKPREAVVRIVDATPPTNRPPVVEITRPLDGQTFVAPVNIPLRAVAVDPDGYVPRLAFYAGTNLIAELRREFPVPPPPGQRIVYEAVWTNPPMGRHLLTARVNDNQGAESVSAPVLIWVVRTNEPPVTNLPPVVTITAPDSVASEGTNCLRWEGRPCPPPLTNGPVLNTATFVVRRSGPTNEGLTVWYRIGGTASNGVDYLELPGRITIPAGRRAEEIRVVPIDDLLPERLETVVLGLRVPPDTVSNVPPYLVGYPGRAAAVIVDNDEPRPPTGLLADRSFLVMRPGEDGTCWRIESSTNLKDWLPICTTTVTDGAISFVDPDAEDAPQRYYRAVREQHPPAE